MQAKWIPMKEWLRINYGDFPPCRRTIHNWIKNAKIQPEPVKHGREYFFRPNAEYCDPNKPQQPSLVDRLGKVA